MEPMLLWISEKKDQVIYGKIWHTALGTPIEFAGAGQMVLRMEEICEREGRLSAKEAPRFLNEPMERRYRERLERLGGQRGYRANADINANIDSNIESNIESDTASFLEKEFPKEKAKVLLVADIRSRENCSMQGTVRGPLTGGKYVYFRSALELMRMIDLIEV